MRKITPPSITPFYRYTSPDLKAKECGACHGEGDVYLNDDAGHDYVNKCKSCRGEGIITFSIHEREEHYRNTVMSEVVNLAKYVGMDVFEMCCHAARQVNNYLNNRNGHA